MEIEQENMAHRLNYGQGSKADLLGNRTKGSMSVCLGCAKIPCSISYVQHQVTNRAMGKCLCSMRESVPIFIQPFILYF